MKKISLIFILFLIGCAQTKSIEIMWQTNPMLAEVYAVKLANGWERKSVDTIIMKYIPLGTSKQLIHDHLQNLGFQIKNQPARQMIDSFSYSGDFLIPGARLIAISFYFDEADHLISLTSYIGFRPLP